MEKLVMIKYASVNKIERLRIMREVAPLWREMGCLMGINPHHLKAIELDRKCIETDCCWDVFLVWLEKRQGSYPVTWEGLCDLFDDLELSQLSKKIRQLL